MLWCECVFNTQLPLQRLTRTTASPRCLLSNSWSVRVAALREAHKHLALASEPEPQGHDAAVDLAERRAAASKSGGKLLPPGSPQVLMQASSLVERALRDTVARVYAAGLDVLRVMVDAYLPAVKGREFLVKGRALVPPEWV